MTEAPQVILASVIYKDNSFLLIRGKSAGKIIYNQAAGHLEHAIQFVFLKQEESPQGNRLEG